MTLKLNKPVKYLPLLALVVVSMVHASKSSDFWSWFQANEASFPSTSEFDELYGDALSKRLTDIESGLVYEISIPKDGQNELIISADGIKDLIPSVRSLVDAAPALNRWKITAFRPRMDDYSSFTLDFSGRIFDPKEMWCWSRIQDGNFDLIIYHENYSDDTRNHFTNGSYILLDMALGEFDVMTGIRYIDHRELPSDPKSAGLYQFENLRSVFDEYKSKVTH